uniref:Uncharacterized protein n=1 Tax=Candidatus Kentrum sp. DK TaxID=2126562 RepID=A0A450S247_9GAMM|nr:MAG: hypothetical protein BECKDK2373C_GA0170839_101260 [Candidatus Kentron sp. DK]
MAFNYHHFPEWLEGSTIFRKLFLYRKMYLTKTTSHHFGRNRSDPLHQIGDSQGEVKFTATENQLVT